MMKTVTKTTDRGVLDRLLNPLRDCFTPAVARRIVKFRADAETQARIDELADKCSQGQLTADERQQYEDIVDAIDMITVLQGDIR